MDKSNNSLSDIIDGLTQVARANHFNDSQWATRSGLPRETLSRLRHRKNCDFSTLAALANSIDVRLGIIVNTRPQLTADGRFPAEVNRDYEETLLRLCVSRSLSVERWIALGPHFFMAGLAVMLASVTGFDRRELLILAESLSPGMSEPQIFEQWLKQSPLRPSRFLPMLNKTVIHAA